MSESKSKMAQKSTLQAESSLGSRKGTYKPPDLLAVIDKDERYAYRWLNVNKFQKNGYRDHRGWEVVRKTDGERASQSSGVNGQTELDGTTMNGDLILARMPVEDAEARNEYYRQKSDVRSRLTEIRAQGSRDGIERGVHFQSQRGKQVIKDGSAGEV